MDNVSNEELRRSLKYTVDVTEDMIRETDDAEKIKTLTEAQVSAAKELRENMRAEDENKKDDKKSKMDMLLSIANTCIQCGKLIVSVGCLAVGAYLAKEQKYQEDTEYVKDKETKRTAFDFLKVGRNNF